MPPRPPRLDRLHVLVAAALIGAAGCADTSLDTLDGVHLGEPRSAVWGLDPYGTVMVVLSDFPELCSALDSVEPPGQRAWWVVSVWTDGALREEIPLAATGFASVTQGGATREYTSRAAEIEIDAYEGDDTGDDDGGDEGERALEGHVWIDFPTGDRVEADFEADACDASLFRGM